MTGPKQNILMFYIKIEHKSSCGTKIFYYLCKILFIIILLKCFFEVLKILQTCFFEYLDNAWSCPSITIVSTSRNFDAQSAEIDLYETLIFICMQKKSTLSLTY